MSIFARNGGPVSTVERYCAANNANDLAAATALMAHNIRMIDSAGDTVVGRANVVTALRRFYSIAPDYRIEISDISARGRQVLIRGHTTCSDERLTGDVLWRVIADDRRIHEWQSYSVGGTPNLTRILMPELGNRPPIESAATAQASAKAR